MTELDKVHLTEEIETTLIVVHSSLSSSMKKEEDEKANDKCFKSMRDAFYDLDATVRKEILGH